MSLSEILNAPLPELKDDDYVLVFRFGFYRDGYMTKREYEAYRKRVLNTPLP